MADIGSYEQHCIDYALYGDPMRDHYDYEEAARYDRWDGYRDEFLEPEDMGCPECGERGDCDACVDAKAALAAFEAERAAREACDDNSDVPF